MNELRLAYISEDLIAAKVLIHECLNLTAQPKHNHSYSIAIHEAYTLSGLIALKEGKVEEAKACIINSGLIPVSLELRRKAPNMILAHELLLLNESTVVLSYLKICKKTWLSKEEVEKIETWERSIINDHLPEFGPYVRHDLFS